MRNFVSTKLRIMATNNKIIQPRYTMFQAPISSAIHTPYRYMTLQDVAELIRSDEYHIKTVHLREMKDEKEQRKFKQKALDYVCFGGMFNGFSDKELVMPSMHICVDLDHIEDVEELEQRLLMDEYFETQLMFRSPRGNGVKWVIDVKDEILKCGYGNTFEAIRNYLMQQYQLSDKQVDRACRNISRATYLCEDKNVYLNDKLIIK